MEIEGKGQDSEEDEINDSGVGSEKEERQEGENNNFATPNYIKEKKGRKREAGKVFGEDLKPRIKKKKVVKKISREEEEEEELKLTEEKIVHRQKARLAVRDDAGWEERGQGEVKLMKHLQTGQTGDERSSVRGGLSQPVAQSGGSGQLHQGRSHGLEVEGP